MQIRPISDLRNKFTEIEKAVQDGSPVYLTKHGYGSMVVMSMETYNRLTFYYENALDLADKAAKDDPTRLTHEEVFNKIRGRVSAE